MARRHPCPQSFGNNSALAARLAHLRIEVFGTEGRPEMAKRLGIPCQTWNNYEAGVIVPGVIILMLIELTSVEPRWLLNGAGPMFQRGRNGFGELADFSPLRASPAWAFRSCN
jgi:hypothetical protein